MENFERIQHETHHRILNAASLIMENEKSVQSKITPEDLEDAFEEKVRTSHDTVVNAKSMTPRERAGLLIKTAREDSIYPVMKAETDALAMYQKKVGEEKAYWREVLYLIQMANNG